MYGSRKSCERSCWKRCGKSRGEAEEGKKMDGERESKQEIKAVSLTSDDTRKVLHTQFVWQ